MIGKILHALYNFFVTRMLMRDLFALTNILVYPVTQCNSCLNITNIATVTAVDYGETVYRYC